MKLTIVMNTAAQQEIVQDICDKHLERLAPPWLQELTVRYVRDPDVHAEVEVDTEYIRAVIRLGASFFADDDTEEDFIHELVHILLAPATKVSSVVIEKFAPKNSLAFDWQEHGEEFATQNLTVVLMRLLQQGE